MHEVGWIVGGFVLYIAHRMVWDWLRERRRHRSRR